MMAMTQPQEPPESFVPVRQRPRPNLPDVARCEDPPSEPAAGSECLGENTVGRSGPEEMKSANAVSRQQRLRSRQFGESLSA
jgi:hypothetical protein